MKFIEQHGYVKYPVYGYIRESICEIPGCTEDKAGNRWLEDMKYVLDHCHKHGWIRGVICQSCNFMMGEIDAGRNAQNQLDYSAFRLNCPECAGLERPIPSKVPDEYIQKTVGSCDNCGKRRVRYSATADTEAWYCRECLRYFDAEADGWSESMELELRRGPYEMGIDIDGQPVYSSDFWDTEMGEDAMYEQMLMDRD